MALEENGLRARQDVVATWDDREVAGRWVTEYDVVGQVSKLTYPDGKEMERNYTDRGQLAGIDFDGTTIDTRTYDDGGRMLTSSYNNGVSETRAYNNDNTLASINFTGARIGNLSYGWDANKNKTSEGITGTMSGYGFDVGTSGYDDEDRLVSWQRDDNNLDQSWNLSLVGDWNSITTSGVGFQPAVQSRTHGPTHELLTAAGQAVQHDAKGNQTLLPANLSSLATSRSFKWDFENKLIGADTDNDSVDDVTYQWDALGRRVARHSVAAAQTTVFVQSGQQTIADYTSGTAAASPTYNYVYASYIDEPVMRSGSGGLVYYHRNQQYSITAITNGGGTVTERYAYTAYGTPTIADANGTAISNQQSAIANRYTYTGREYDETLNLYHYRARMYYAGAGRFCSRDPIGYASDILLYGYCSRSPLDKFDPSGLDNLANYSAGISDSLTMGATDFVRSAIGINDGIDSSSGYYIAGEATEIIVEVAVTGGAAASRHIARRTVRQVVEGGARAAYRRTHKIKGGIIHHATPIIGHIGGKPSYFPLPYEWAARGAWNFQYVSNVPQHAAMHRRLIAQERWLRNFNWTQPVRNGGNLIIQHILNDGPTGMLDSTDLLPFSSISISFEGSRTIYYEAICPERSSFGYSASGMFESRGETTFANPRKY